MKSRETNILHVEDDPTLAGLVLAAFETFGFAGSIIPAESLREALSLLKEREERDEPVDLIISDIQLPDGNGLDFVREVRSSACWCNTPIIMLSSESDAEVINAAYALGANSFMPKLPESGSLIESLQSLYSCWIENPRLLLSKGKDRLHGALDRAITLRARTAEFDLSLARAFQEGSSEMRFWLDRALNEGNLSNLLAFFRYMLDEKDVPVDVVDRISRMQMHVVAALKTAEDELKTVPEPDIGQSCQWALELTDALDEEVFAEALSYLFPVSSAAATALKARAACQLKSLALHILEQTEELSLREKAVSLLNWSHRLETMTGRNL